MNDSIDIQKIIEGCLLGDGHLELHKQGINANFDYTSSSKQHIEFIHKYFIDYCSENYKTIKIIEKFDKRTNKTYVSYRFKTKCHPIFTEQQSRFYKNRIKIIPQDLQIDKHSLLMWYIGDGQLSKDRGFIKLHTNSFKLNEVEHLCKLLNIFKAKPVIKEQNQYVIYIPRKKVKEFLTYIGVCPFNDYKHKWTEVPYKNKNIEINGVNYYSEFYPNIVEDFNTGKYSIYKLSLKYNVHIKCIKNHFDSNNIVYTAVDNKKPIIQYNLENNIIKEWKSGSEINKTLNYNCSAISECCRGVRKMYKGFIWKFK